MVTVPVNGMSASHEHHSLRRCEHIFVANWAVTVTRPLNTFVALFHGDIHAEAASLRRMLDLEIR